jgi:hypothetical protein
MKNLLTSGAFLVLVIIINVTGCDTSSDSGKATSISPPALTAPPDGDTTVGVRPTFQWTGSADIIHVATSEQFTNIVYNTPVSGQAHTSSFSFTKGTWYWWRVGVTSSGVVYWSNDVWKFRPR